MLTAEFLRNKFAQALPYADYVATAKPSERPGWDRAHAAAILTPPQVELARSFTRRMNILVTSGTWCGDCSAQCPMLARLAEAAPRGIIDLRFLDRDQHKDLAERIMICGGLRVPTAIFMAEDFEFVALLGDRTLSRYRAIAARKLGAACPLPGAPTPPEETAATLQDWLNEFERVHLVLRLSPRLREKHKD